jgi:hypothetical protein
MKFIKNKVIDKRATLIKTLIGPNRAVILRQQGQLGPFSLDLVRIFYKRDTLDREKHILYGADIVVTLRSGLERRNGCG